MSIKRTFILAIPIALLLMAALALLFPRTEASEYVNGVVVASLGLAALGDFVWGRWKGRRKDEEDGKRDDEER